MRRIAPLILLAALLPAVAGGAAGAGAGASAPSVLTVVVADPPARTLVKLAPGFASVFQFDRAITRVALGDDRLVAFHVDAERGDLTMKPLVPSGRTNMVVWAGQAITLWELLITRDERTADVIRVVTGPRPDGTGAAPGNLTPPGGTPASAAPPAGAAPPSGSPSPPAPSAPTPATSGPPYPAPASSAAPRPPAEPAEPAPAFLQATAQGDGLEAVFQAMRVRWGVVVRYRLANRSADGTKFRLQPQRILVRANGRIVPFALMRQPGAGGGAEDLLAPGATETGTLSIAGRMTQLHVLFPIGPAHGAGLPVLLEASFAGLHRLLLQPAP